VHPCFSPHSTPSRNTIPYPVLQVLKQLIDLQTSKLRPLPLKVETTKLVQFAQLDMRYVTHVVTRVVTRMVTRVVTRVVTHTATRTGDSRGDSHSDAHSDSHGGSHGRAAV